MLDTAYAPVMTSGTGRPATVGDLRAALAAGPGVAALVSWCGVGAAGLAGHGPVIGMPPGAGQDGPTAPAAHRLTGSDSA